MKKTTWSHRFLMMGLLLALQSPAQTNSNLRLNPENALIPIPFNCGTVFWTTNAAGQIKQWNLINGAITGGTQILTAGNVNGLAYGGDGNTPVFNCAIDGGMRRYDQNGWTNTLFASSFLSNNGSYVNDSYFMSYSTGTIVYFNGNTATEIPLEADEIYAVADIAVDSSGNAWVFTQIGSDVLLKVFNSGGLIATYPIAMNPTGVYGAFFINDQLYIATVSTPTLAHPNSILPVVLEDDSAELGTPIPFICNNYTDLASCNITTLSTYDINKSALKVYPNPTTGILTIASPNEISEVAVYTIEGKLILKQKENQNTVDLTNLPTGSYLLELNSGATQQRKVIIKD